VSDPGRHSFGYFSFAAERKVTRQQAETKSIRLEKKNQKTEDCRATARNDGEERKQEPGSASK
jgi:hypothetical protein